jgi:hypothetical protein
MIGLKKEEMKGGFGCLPSLSCTAHWKRVCSLLIHFNFLMRTLLQPPRADNVVSKNNLDKGMPAEANHAYERSDPAIRIGDSTVMLGPCVALRVNSAKHLAAQRARPFAAAQGDRGGADDVTSLYAALASFIIHI